MGRATFRHADVAFGRPFSPTGGAEVWAAQFCGRRSDGKCCRALEWRLCVANGDRMADFVGTAIVVSPRSLHYTWAKQKYIVFESVLYIVTK